MLTRLKVSGFKNLVNIDVRFGPFTCIAGANGVGKSNLLDAILFLSALADGPLLNAALSVRDQGSRSGDVRGLFHRVGDAVADDMAFEAEMIIPESGTDDLGQRATATATFVRYSVSLSYKRDEGARALGSLELMKEELKHITLGDAEQQLVFPHSAAWKKRFLKNTRRTPNYISTEGEGPDRVIKVHLDGGRSGKPQRLLAATLPRTVLSVANSTESPTATLVKREMQSWRLLQLEPSALREPDNFTAPAELGSEGAHLPAMLFHLANKTGGIDNGSSVVYSDVTNRLSQLIDEIRTISVDRDESRQLLTIYATGRDRTVFPARALSDGTLRFLALTALSINPDLRGVICMEEPENGIHPERIPAMIQLLRDLATDVTESHPSSTNDQLRQVIINTHSPAVVQQVPEDSLLMAESVEVNRNGKSFRELQLRHLPGTWRVGNGSMDSISSGRLLPYLNPVARIDDADSAAESDRNTFDSRHSRRVVDREDLGQLIFRFDELSS